MRSAVPATADPRTKPILAHGQKLPLASRLDVAASSISQQQRQQQQQQQQQHAPARPQPQSQRRRSALLSAAAAALLGPACKPWPAAAALVDETVAQGVFSLATRSVVSINDYNADAFEGVGTGFVWSKYGHIVTNYHVVSKYVLDKTGQQVVKVMLDGGGSSSSSSGEGSDGSSSGGSSGGSSSSGSSSTLTYTARVVATDALHDLAVLQIDAPPDLLVPIRVGSSEDLKVGQSVFAVGNPGGLSKTLTAGVVSGLNRTIPAPTGTRIYGAIQTDASVNAGNSGGPLLDSFGRLVGVCTASFARASSGRGSGVNFALPVDLVRSVVPNLIITGSASGRGVRSG